MTNVEPTPVFRRFPWVQLVFCLACLSMTAYTWMRYSYAWDVTPGELVQRHFQRERSKAKELFALREAYLEKGGGGLLKCLRVEDDIYVRVKGTVCARGLASDRDDTRASTTDLRGEDDVIVAGGCDHAVLVCLPEEEPPPAVGDAHVFAGRVIYTYWLHNATDQKVDATASRFHPASVAGLVVGAMGCFIFGLYLRSWLRAKKALASSPGQDMIA